MQESTTTPVVTPTPAKPKAKTRRKKQVLWAVVALAVLLIAGFGVWQKSPPNLGKGDSMKAAGVYARWDAGDIVVLVRHAERCDRSSNPCLGPADGITRLGSDTAAELGKAFMTMGMSNADVFSSPLTRTAQTSLYMFGKASAEQDWLVNCETSMLQDVVAHKTPHRNLVLVTHSGCISKFEHQLGFKHAATSEYSSALFVSVGTDGKPNVLGIVNVQDWPSVLNKKP